MALTETLNKPVTDPFASIGRIAAGEDVSARAAIARKELEPLAREESAATEAAKLREAELKRAKAQEETRVEQEFAGKKRQAFEEYERGLPQQPMFNPTKFDAGAAVELAGLTAVLGTLAGGISARAALKSMEGFTKGAREGRADLYDQEVKQFQKDLGAWKNNVEMAKNRLTQIIDLLSTDKNAALVKMKELEPSLDEGLIRSQVRMNRPQRALEIANKASQAGDQAEIALAKTLGKDPSKIKLSDKLIERWTTRTNLIDDLKKALPIMERLKKEGTWSKLSWTMLADPRAAEYSMRNDPEAVQLVRILAKLRGKEFETAGKALTQREDQILRPVFGVTGRLDDAAIATVAEAIKEMEQSNKGLLAGVEGMPEFVTRYEILLRTQGNPNAYRELKESANDLRNAPAPSTEPNVNRANLPTPRTQAEFDALDPGALYVDPDDNKIYRKPKARQ